MFKMANYAEQPQWGTKSELQVQIISYTDCHIRSLIYQCEPAKFPLNCQSAFALPFTNKFFANQRIDVLHALI